MVWYVWWERRSFTHGEHVAEPPIFAHAISALVKNFVMPRKRHPDSGTGSTGAVLRSNKGVFIAGSCSDISFAEDASSAEARALRDGLLLASEVGVQQIIVESDCQDVIDIMLLDGNSLGPAAAVYEECSFLVKNFSLIQFAFGPREENMVAHTLARLIRNQNTSQRGKERKMAYVSDLQSKFELLRWETNSQSKRVQLMKSTTDWLSTENNMFKQSYKDWSNNTS
ncbi:reverse transcriptase [Hordeum vulgare]|nr:reverse transcriptase [Hordeum vulgare]